MAKLSSGPNREILEAALQGLEAQKQKLDEQITQVRAMLGGRGGRPSKSAQTSNAGAATASPATGRRKRVLSAEARKRIAAAQKKRWAAFRKTQG